MTPEFEKWLWCWAVTMIALLLIGLSAKAGQQMRIAGTLGAKFKYLRDCAVVATFLTGAFFLLTEGRGCERRIGGWSDTDCVEQTPTGSGRC